MGGSVFVTEMRRARPPSSFTRALNLPCFAAFPLLADGASRERLRPRPPLRRAPVAAPAPLGYGRLLRHRPPPHRGDLRACLPESTRPATSPLAADEFVASPCFLGMGVHIAP